MDRDILKENRVHGDSMFPFGIYSVNCSNNTILDCHWHDELEFLTVTEGKAVFQIGTFYYEVNKGQSIFINSGEIHAGYPIKDYPCSFYAIVFNPNLLFNSTTMDAIQLKYIEPLLNKRFLIPAYIKSNENWEKDISHNLSQISNIVSTKPFAYELLVKARLFDIFSLLFSNSCKIVPANCYKPDTYKVERLKNIIEFIHANYNRKISLKEIALHNNMSEGHLCRFFKEMVRRTPVDYINYYRVNKAARLLLDGSKKIIDVGIDTGFENCSYFINTFKHYMKCTPSEYRALKKQQ